MVYLVKEGAKERKGLRKEENVKENNFFIFDFYIENNNKKIIHN